MIICPRHRRAAALPLHGNLLHYHDSFLVADHLHIVTDFIRGKNLGDFMAVNVPVRVLLSWAYQVCFLLALYVFIFRFYILLLCYVCSGHESCTCTD